MRIVENYFVSIYIWINLKIRYTCIHGACYHYDENSHSGNMAFLFSEMPPEHVLVNDDTPQPLFYTTNGLLENTGTHSGLVIM